MQSVKKEGGTYSPAPISFAHFKLAAYRIYLFGRYTAEFPPNDNAVSALLPLGLEPVAVVPPISLLLANQLLSLVIGSFTYKSPKESAAFL